MFPLAFNLQSDWRITVFVAAIAIVVTLICGMYPIRQSLRVSQRDALHEGSTAVAGSTRKRIGQRILLGIQLGICFIVLACCGLLTRTSLNIFNRPVGFDRANTLTTTIDLSRAGYSDDRARLFPHRASRSPARTLPASLLPRSPRICPWATGDPATRAISAFPVTSPAKGEDTSVVTDFDGPDFFHTMGIQILQGRDFSFSDNDTAAKVAVINEDMAHRYWPKGNALGSSIVVDKVQRQIVGIVHDFAYHSPDNTDPTPVVFLPLLQGKSGYGYAIIAIHSRTGATAVAPQLRKAVADLDSSAAA